VGFAARRARPSWPGDQPESGELADRGELAELGELTGPGKRAGPGRRASASPAGADPPADPEAVARLICLRQLTAAPRTRAQLADTLRKRGIPDSAAEAVLSRFTEVGLIDDATFASAWVESRHYGRGLGRRALEAELRQRGVDRGDIQAAVGNLSPERELATARALVARRLASTAGQAGEVRFRRLAGMLARKGYPAGIVYQVVRDALAQEGEHWAGDGLEDELLSAECEAERGELADSGSE
jgi:regulatory protein